MAKEIRKWVDRDYLVPHPWGEWETQQRQAHIAKPPLQAKTILDEIIKVNTYQISPWSWQSKYLTTSCSTCPLYIPENQTLLITPTLKNHLKRTKVVISEHPDGICAVGLTSFNSIIYKFLVTQHLHQIRACNVNEKTRQERVKLYREIGILKKSLS